MTTLTAYNAAWTPSSTQATVAPSDFLIALFNPGSRTGYAWPSITATYVKWPPLKAVFGASRPQVFVST